VFLCDGYYVLFLLFYYCICAATFVEYIAFLFSAVLSAVLGSACFPCILALFIAYVLLPGIRFL
jgi:hypothetical protein